MKTGHILFVDTETGGLDPKAHSLLTLGACWFNTDDGKIEDTFEVAIKHDCYSVTGVAMGVNGIQISEHHQTAVPITEASDKFLQWVKDKKQGSGSKITVGGHNVLFDKGFIESALGLNWGRLFFYGMVDTQIIATFLNSVEIISLKGTSLDSLVGYFNINRRQPHAALSDAIASAMSYMHMQKILIDITLG